MKSIPEKRPASPPPHKKILFMNGNSRLIRALWSAECDEKAARYGFEVAIPARDRDLPAEAWPQLLPEYDGVITSWGPAGRWIKLSCSLQNGVLNVGKRTKKKRQMQRL